MMYNDFKKIVIQELDDVLTTVDEQAVEKLVNSICKAECVFVVGVGRVMLVLQAFVKRLNHLGIHATYVGSIDEPAIGEKDLLIVASGSGESVVPLVIAKLAKSYGAAIVHIGSNADSSMNAYASDLVRIPCQTKLHLEDEIPSQQLMSSLFEQSLLLLFDIISMMIFKKRSSKDIQTLWKMHANLE